MSTLLELTELPALLGRGYSFPLRIDPRTDDVSFSEGEEGVWEDMKALLLTDVSDRPFLTKNGVPFGTRNRSVLFDSPETALDILRYDCRVALVTWEPRIELISVSGSISRTTNLTSVLININFRFRATNRLDNRVLPFNSLRI